MEILVNIIKFAFHTLKIYIVDKVLILPTKYAIPEFPRKFQKFLIIILCTHSINRTKIASKENTLSIQPPSFSKE